MEILFGLFKGVVGGIVAQPSPRSKATAEKPNGHIGNENAPSSGKRTLNCRLIMHRNLSRSAKRFYLRMQ
jgi:hypothetical protein